MSEESNKESPVVAEQPKPKKAKKPKTNGKPKMSRKLKKEIESSTAKLNFIIRHIRNVQDNCILLGNKLIAIGEVSLGRMLIANGFIHDNSKFYGTEWDNMVPAVTTDDQAHAKLKLKLSVMHHNTTNSHHPEYWGGVHHMPKLAICEMVCDWKARSEEFGSSLRDWIANSATKRFGFCDKDPVYKTIFDLVDMICEKPFEQITK